MKKRALAISLIACMLFYTGINHAQAQTSDALEYMESITSQFSTIMDDTWDYTSSVAHSKNANKIDSKRKALLVTLTDAMKKIKAMPDFKGDASLRDSALSFLNIDYNVLNSDYEKIVDMEAIADSSYDLMEAYLNAQVIAGKKLDTANTNLMAIQRVFAEKNDITITENKDKVTIKLENSAKVFEHYNKVYLIFFKSYKQDAYLWNAVSGGDLSLIEQNKKTLLETTTQGLALLDSVSSFKGDLSLITACKKALLFYKSEAGTKLQDITDYLVSKEKFDIIKKEFDGKAQASRTKDDVDAYNKAVEEVNNASTKYNTSSQKLFTERNAILESWNTAGTAFLDKQVPKY